MYTDNSQTMSCPDLSPELQTHTRNFLPSSPFECSFTQTTLLICPSAHKPAPSGAFPPQLMRPFLVVQDKTPGSTLSLLSLPQPSFNLPGKPTGSVCRASNVIALHYCHCDPGLHHSQPYPGLLETGVSQLVPLFLLVPLSLF